MTNPGDIRVGDFLVPAWPRCRWWWPIGAIINWFRRRKALKNAVRVVDVRNDCVTITLE